jgi:Domain of unknown function (DUF1833)
MSFIENRQRTTDFAGVLQFLEISAPSFPDTLRLVNDSINWTVNGQEYIAMPFRIKLPTDASGTAGSIDIEMDNVGRNMTEELERLPPNEMVMARIRLSDRDDPGNFFRDIPMPIVRVSVNANSATATASMDSVMRQQACRLRANEFTLPGIFT